LFLKAIATKSQWLIEVALTMMQDLLVLDRRVQHVMLNSICEPARKYTIRPRAQSGFTLIEIAVAVFILAIGVLGVTGMQSVGVRESQNTYFRGQANLLVGEWAETMRMFASVGQEPDTEDLQTAIDNAGLPNAGFDVLLIDEIFTAGEVTASVYDVQIYWNEARNGQVPENCAAATACVSWRTQI